MGDERIRSWSGSALSVSQSDRPGKDFIASYLLKYLPANVKDFSWELQNEIAQSLNPLKQSGNDWRLVASRLGLSRIIPQLEQKANPTVDLLRECTDVSTEGLLRILIDIKRTDVLDDIQKFINIGNSHVAQIGPKLPTQESLEGSTASDLSWPLQDSGNASENGYKSKSIKPQESEEKGDAFLSSDSEKFWLNIPGDYDHKMYLNFFEAAKAHCPEELQQGNVDKFLCKVLNIEYGQRKRSTVGLHYFLQLVALFGPFKPGPDGCLQKMYDVMRQSTSKSQNGTRESWFAGNMNETEAAERLLCQSPGHFLIRISSSRAHEGVFVLAVRTHDEGVVQVQIERNLESGALLLARRTFDNLILLVDALRRDVLLDNCRQLLINPCPDLPFNAIFSGYVKDTPVHARGRGRGRGRARR